MRDRNFALAREAGAAFVRTDFDRYLGTDVLDSLIVSASRNNMQILGILDRGVYSSSGFAWTDSVAYGGYLRSLFGRYGEAVRYWEALNEVDLLSGADSLSAYPALLPFVQKTLRSMSPNGVLLLSGVASVRSSLFSTLFESGAVNYCDVLNMHSYSSPEELLPQLQHVASLANQYGVRKPIWLTETGCHTAPDPYDNKYFFLQVLPQAIQRIGLSNPRVGVVADSVALYFSMNGDEVADLLPGYDVQPLSLTDLEGLSPQDVPVLVLSSDEAFPMRFFSSVVDYVRRGGVVALAQGLPFYYDVLPDGSKVQVGDAYWPQLHMAALLWWSGRAKSLGAPELPSWCRSADGFSVSANWRFEKWCSARYLSDERLAPGDSLIPIVLAGNNQFSGAVAGLYKFNSDLKGAAIVSTRLDAHHYVNPLFEQARRVARCHLLAWASGVEKVFWYNWRAFEKNPNYSEDHYGLLHADFSPKPGLAAYQTLSSLLPNGSSRPVLSLYGNVYVASWLRPDGVPVSALWSRQDIIPIGLSLLPSSAVYDFMGVAVPRPSDGRFWVSPAVIYVVGQVVNL